MQLMRLQAVSDPGTYSEYNVIIIIYYTMRYAVMRVCYVCVTCVVRVSHTGHGHT